MPLIKEPDSTRALSKSLIMDDDAGVSRPTHSPDAVNIGNAIAPTRAYATGTFAVLIGTLIRCTGHIFLSYILMIDNNNDNNIYIAYSQNRLAN